MHVRPTWPTLPWVDMNKIMTTNSQKGLRMEEKALNFPGEYAPNPPEEDVPSALRRGPLTHQNDLPGTLRSLAMGPARPSA